MKIQANRVDDFIRGFGDDVRGVLIYGPDSGLVQIRKQEILQKVLPNYKNSLSLINIDSSILKDKPNIISDEYNSSSLFGGDKKIILIDGAENSISKNLENIFNKQQNTQNFIIITADDLDSKSALKRFAEYNEFFGSLPCYKDDVNSIMQLVSSKLRNNNFKFATDVVRYLAESFGGDRLVIMNEIDKLIIYKGDDKNISLEDVSVCIKDNSESDVGEFVNNLASLNFDKAFKELQNLYSDGVVPIIIIRSVIGYFLKLQLFKYQLKNGLSFDDIATRENIFWKQKPLLQQHLHKLTEENINNVLFVLLKEESKLKGKIKFSSYYS